MPQPPEFHWRWPPLLLWYGDIDKVPSCPANAPGGTYFHAEPASVSECPPCSCGDPACVLPAGLIASDTTSTCQGPTYTPFAGHLDGRCSDNGGVSIDPNAAKSLRLVPPTVSPCAPAMDVKKGGTVAWNKVGLTCSGHEPGECAASAVCVPSAPAAPSGFRQCVVSANNGVENDPCPSAYPDKVLFYHEIDWGVACTACVCDPIVASQCTAEVSVFYDPSCNDHSKYVDENVSLGASPCLTVPVNTEIGGMMSQWVTNNPGACAPNTAGGQPTGNVAVDHSSAIQFCCAPEGSGGA